MISMLLAILICLLLCIPAAATEINSECKYDSGYAIVIIPSGNGEQITLAVRDCANGDVEFVLREDNEVVSRVYLNCCESTIRAENYAQPSGPETTVNIKGIITSQRKAQSNLIPDELRVGPQDPVHWASISSTLETIYGGKEIL